MTGRELDLLHPPHTKVQQEIGTGTAQVERYLTEYAYNLAGELETETYPSKRMFGYCQDPAGRTTLLQGKADLAATSWRKYASATWTAHDAIHTLTAFDGAGLEAARQVNGYNNRLQPTTSETLKGTTQLLKLTLGYPGSGNNGNIESQTVEYPSRQVVTPTGTVTIPAANRGSVYTYDALNRLKTLTESVSALTEGYDYDVFGNRWVTGRGGAGVPGIPSYVPQSASNYSPNGTIPSNRIAGVEHDDLGNMKALLAGANGANPPFRYDAESMLKTSVMTAGARPGTTEYWYDGNGRRVRKEGPGGNESYVYNAAGQLIAEYTTETTGVEAGLRWMMTDHLGSTRLVLDEVGGFKQRYDYFPFGEEIPAGVNGRHALDYRVDVAAVDRDRRKFTGHQRDVETGLDYFGARYFGAPMGRFTGPDPKMFPDATFDPQSWNKYGYVRNNPLSLTDPDGQDWRDKVSGVFNGIHASYTYGLTKGSGNSDYRFGQQVGAKIAQGLGYIQTAIGGTIAGGGAAACGTGVGCVVTPGAVATGVAVGAHGLSVAASAEIVYSEAAADTGPYETTSDNLERMDEGKAPIGKDGHPVELHHENQANQGSLKEMTRTEHRLGENFKKNHQNTGQATSQIDRKQFAKDRKDHWKAKAQQQRQESQQGQGQQP